MERPAPSKSDLDRVTIFLLYLAQVILVCKNKGKYCTNIVDIITLVPLSLRTSDMAVADTMTPVKVLHQLVTLAFISIFPYKT